jgi:WD40 repeat protein
MDSTYVPFPLLPSPPSNPLFPYSAILTDLITQQPLQTFQHAKFVVRSAFSADGRWLATASYDRTIVLYEDTQWGRPQHRDAEEEEDVVDQGDDRRLARDPSLRYEARHRVVLQQNPESIVFDSRGRYLLYTTRGSHWLSYIHLPSPPSTATDEGEPFATSRKSFNVHPEDTHISFAVLNIVLDPTGRLVACQTGDHAGGTGERILIYDIDLPAPHPTPAPRTGDLPTRGNWLSSSPSESTPRENERLSVIWTGQQGDDYILPRLAWLPDSSGIITTTTTGELVLHSLGGEQVKTLKVHGKADGRGRGGRPVGQQASEVVRDVCVVGERDDVSGWRVVSVGYDATVRIS